MLHDLEMRNSEVYRSIFGMTPLPSEALSSMSADDALLEEIGRNGLLRDSYVRMDRLMLQTFLQSKSFDEVAALSKRAGEMASCIPAIPPIDPDPRHFNISSPFGVRVDPVYGGERMHSGVDFSTKKGTPIYATGDGTVKSAQFLFYGYGNVVTIDHGFGYETMYAHMDEVFVVEGMPIKRGQCIGTVGRSGKATGDHLHYEVLYRDNKVNPANFYDLSMSKEEYAKMVQKREAESPAMLRSGFRVRTR
jgi:murein DD-endopeptidase MepM/ murein hydrolase activator NlpD